MAFSTSVPTETVAPIYALFGPTVTSLLVVNVKASPNDTTPIPLIAPSYSNFNRLKVLVTVMVFVLGLSVLKYPSVI